MFTIHQENLINKTHNKRYKSRVNNSSNNDKNSNFFRENIALPLNFKGNFNILQPKGYFLY